MKNKNKMEAISMRKLKIALALFLICIFMAGCSPSWTCSMCGDDFRGRAYYDVLMDREWVLCESSAREYWAPLNFRDFQVR
ncbi:MAG: hypothetical protein FWC91_09490 [Defluviitaleaceae bacterium]|nr:hypothetical protein [Defluviitaleaceae bacterium]